MAGLSLACVAGLAGCASVSGLETKARILSEPPCTDFFFPIYFRDRSAEISRAAQKVIMSSGKHADGCMVREVRVVGLASQGQGAPSDNLALSQQRAEAVADALAKAGLPRPTFQLSALGEAGAITSDGAKVPLRRRADVYIRFQH